MPLGLDIRVARDVATPAVRAVSAGLRPEVLQPIVGRSATNTIRDHLFGVNINRPNRLGGARTNFYAQAARATSFKVAGDFVVVSIASVGIAQRFFGGTIKPRTGKYLTIPVHPAAHGKRAREFDLELVFGRNGEPIALATKSSRRAVIRVTATGRVTNRLAGRFGEIYYRLVRSVTQAPDPTVLPYNEQIEAAVQRDVGAYVDRLIARQGGAR